MYAIGKHDSGTFGYFPSGAVRRLSLTEVVAYQADPAAVVWQLKDGDATAAAKVSKALFGV